ncbi:hypothetical protein Tco_1455418 [Tanacetum coccineum]
MDDPNITRRNTSDLKKKTLKIWSNVQLANCHIRENLEVKPHVISERIDEFNLIDEASLSEYDEEIVLRFNDLFNIIHPDDSKLEKHNGGNNINIIQSSKDMAPLLVADQRHPWLRYQIQEYTEGIRHRTDSRDEAGFGCKIEDGVFWRGAVGVYESFLEDTI